MTDLPTYIPLAEAAKQYHISPSVLQQAIKAGTIKAVQVGSEIVVDSTDMKRLTLPVDPALRGKPIRVTAAAEKYSIDARNLDRWADAGYIRVLERGPKLLVLDEGEVQRAVAIFEHACRETGSFVKAGWVLKRILKKPEPKPETVKTG
ncbi:MAG TPA: hypothetical protein PKH77_28345 [Anaerolineae bacterium]|nr:hypothetical protein [Anaerolineae bacterium]